MDPVTFALSDPLGPEPVPSRRRRVQDEAAGLVGQHRRHLLAAPIQENDEGRLDRGLQGFLHQLAAHGLGTQRPDADGGCGREGEKRRRRETAGSLCC